MPVNDNSLSGTKPTMINRPVSKQIKKHNHQVQHRDVVPQEILILRTDIKLATRDCT